MKYSKEDKNLAFVFDDKRIDFCIIESCDGILLNASGGYYNCLWTDDLDILNISNQNLKEICELSFKDFGITKIVCKNKFKKIIKKYNKKFRNEIIGGEEYFIYEFQRNNSPSEKPLHKLFFEAGFLKNLKNFFKTNIINHKVK